MKIVQLFQGVLRLSKGQDYIKNPVGIIGTDKSEGSIAQGIGYSVKTFGKNVLESQKLHGYTGFAWAGRINVLQSMNGFFDFGIVGGSDALMAHAFYCHFDEKIKPYYYKDRFPPGSSLFRNAFHDWSTTACKVVDGQVGYVNGIVQHLWHGSKENRQYQSRFLILAKNKFDPKNHIYKKCKECVWEWNFNKEKTTELARQVTKMFINRQED